MWHAVKGFDRDNYDGDKPAPEGTIWVCGACGRTGKVRYRMRDTSCVMHAVLCYATADGKPREG